jgi:hypothetical protein
VDGVVGAGWQWGGCLRCGCKRVWRQVRVRALARVGASGWALGERYRIEPVFGRVKGVYGSYARCCCGCLACVVLWELVAWLGVSGRGEGFCVGYGFCGWCDAERGNFRTPSGV